MNLAQSTRGLLMIAVLAAAASCSAPSVQQPVSHAALSAPGEPDISGAVAYRVDGAASTFHVMAYRAGAMARLGHNHVLSHRSVEGVAYLHRDLPKSHIELNVPVAGFIVDDAQARAAEGQDFAAEVPADAREGTRRNLLREEVLDAEHFPTITMRSVRISGSRAAPQITMRVALKGNARDVVVPVKVQEEGARLTASGEFTLTQSDFGMKPFSVAMGALQVQDQLKVRFSLVCRQQQ